MIKAVEVKASGRKQDVPPRHRQKLGLAQKLRAVSAICRLYPVSERRLRRRSIIQRHHIAHDASLELNELLDHCQGTLQISDSRIPLALQLLGHSLNVGTLF